MAPRVNATFLPNLSDRRPNEVAPTNLPTETATATDVRQKLFSHTKSHYKRMNNYRICLIK